MNEVERSLLAPGSRPEVPDLARSILDLSRDPTAEVVRLPGLIGADSALSSRILQFLATDLFHVTRGVHSLREAVLNLGLATVRNVALSFTLLSDLARAREASETRDLLLRMALMKALAARAIGEGTGFWRPDEAFLAGFISQSGCLFLHERVPDYPQVLRCFAAGEAELIDLEQPSVRTDHGRLAVLLLRTWRVPGGLLAPIAESFELLPPNQQTDVSRRRGRVLRAADLCARTLCVPGFQHEAGWISRRVLHQVDLAPDQLERLLDQLTDDFWDAAGHFEIPAEGQQGYQDLLTRTQGGSAQRFASGSTKTGQIERHPPAVLDRAAFERLLARVHWSSRATRRAIGLLLIALDGEKPALGSGECDESDTARSIEIQLSRSIRSTDAEARLNGREIAVLVPGCDECDISGVAARLRAAVEQVLAEDLVHPSIDVSIGMVSVRPHFEDVTPDALLDHSLSALDQARRAPDRVHLARVGTA